MRKRLLFVLGLISLFGMGLAIMATVQHFRLLSSGFEAESFCVISDTINCDLVNGSTYSIFWGIPVAWWGTLYYGLLALMSMFAASSRKQRRATVSIAWLMSLAGIPYCIYLAYIAIVVIGAVCVECFGMYAVTLACAIGFFFALRISLHEAPRAVWNYIRGSVVKHAIIIGLVFGIGWIAMLNVQAGDSAELGSKASVDAQLRAHYAQPASHIEIDSTWAVWGNPDAKVKLVEFSEFQCPFCRLASFTVKPYLQEFHKDIAYYFVNFPLDSKCNPIVQHEMHPLACYLSRAAICTNERGNFWKYHNDLFRNQKKLSRELALDIATQDFGWGRQEFESCIDAAATRDALSSQISAGNALSLRGTPALFLDGRQIKNWQDKRFLQTLVKEEIKRSHN